MMPHSENGVKVHFPDNNYFFFGNCAAYKAISAHSVKEMDICWLDTALNTLWCVELKAFDDPGNAKFLQQDLSNGGIVKYWIDELYKKTLHTLCMLETDRSKTNSCIVQGINDQTIFKLVHLINVVHGQETLLQFIQDELKIMLKPILAIYNVHSLTVIPYSLAKNKAILPWIV